MFQIIVWRTAVSYTHLDVYKRQVATTSVRSLESRYKQVPLYYLAFTIRASRYLLFMLPVQNVNT